MRGVAAQRKVADYSHLFLESQDPEITRFARRFAFHLRILPIRARSLRVSSANAIRRDAFRNEGIIMTE